MGIEIPADRAKWHGGDDFYRSGAKLTEVACKLGGLTGESRVIDVGCGSGRVAIGIGERFGWTNPYLGLDIQEVDIDVCREHITSVHPMFRFEHLDVYNKHYNQHGRQKAKLASFPIDDGVFDVAIATSLFTHMYAPETARYLKEIARGLEPGGALFSTWFVLDAASRAAIAAGGRRFAFEVDHGDGTFDNSSVKPGDAVAFDMATARRAFADAGLTFKFFRGRWASDEPTSRLNQDVIVGRKL